jgi:hypothetical protein
VGIDSDGVMCVVQCVRVECNVWTWYVQVASGSGQTGRTGGKCLFVVMFTGCAVQQVLFT